MSKSDARNMINAAIDAYIANGGVIAVIEPARIAWRRDRMTFAQWMRVFG